MTTTKWTFMENVELVVGDCETGAFEGFRARFRGEKIAAFEAEKRLIFTLYRCGWNQYEGYRVYMSDRRRPRSPEYELSPHEGEVNMSDPYRSFHKLYGPDELISEWPVFADYISSLRVSDFDPNEQDPAWRAKRLL